MDLSYNAVYRMVSFSMKKFIKYYISIAYFTLSLLIVNGDAAYAGYENASVRYNEPIQSKKMALQYDVYAGGFKALNAQLSLDLDKKAYDMELSAETEGFIGTLFPWKGDYSTSGHAEKGSLIPSIYTATSTWRSKSNTTEMSYDPNGKLLKTTQQDGNKTTVNRDIDEGLSRDAVDMLTGALMMFQNTKNKQTCKGSFPVFDGKRRFNIVLKDDGKELISKNKYSTFSGEALRCTVKVEPVAGFKEKDKSRGWMAIQTHTEKHHKAPTIWLAKLENKGPIVPVRMEIASDYGSVVAHLSNKASD